MDCSYCARGVALRREGRRQKCQYGRHNLVDAWAETNSGILYVSTPWEMEFVIPGQWHAICFCGRVGCAKRSIEERLVPDLAISERKYDRSALVATRVLGILPTFAQWNHPFLHQKL